MVVKRKPDAMYDNNIKESRAIQMKARTLLLNYEDDMRGRVDVQS